jgi:signal transduction histidine kinase/ActR/RegA family two-component response regulator
VHNIIRLFLQLLVYRFGMASPTVPVAVRRIKLELLLKKLSAIRMLSPLPFATALALAFYLRWQSPVVLAWISLHYAMCIWCYFRRRKLDTHEPFKDHVLEEVLQDRIQDLFLLGSMWGLAAWMLDSRGDNSYFLLVSLFIMGAASLGSAIASTYRETVAAFSIPAVAGMVTACIWQGGVVGWLLACVMTLYLAMTLQWSYQQADLLEESLTVRFEKEDLATRLEQQVELVEEANREKSRFFASASHDLRQPLHAISLFTSVLEKSELDPKSTQTVSQLGYSVHMLSQSLDTMLEVSRLDAGAIQPKLEVLSVHDLFLSLHNTFSVRAQEKGLQLRLRAPGDLTVLSDAQLLERLLGNLIDNAIKYTQKGGVIVAVRSRSASRRESFICFDVIDTGIGIPEEYHQLVFDEFYQLGNPQRDRKFGLGIGLSIVKRLSELLAHPIRLQSEPGRGTRFRVWAPQGGAMMNDVVSYPSRQHDIQIEGKLPARILVVDDEADSREALASLLNSYGCTVHKAGEIEQAEQLLLQHPVEAVVADFRLPGGRNGLDFLLKLRMEAPHIRTLLVTGETAPYRIAAIKQSGMPCLYKPVRAQRLLEALADKGSSTWLP